MLSGKQISAARAIVGMSQAALALAANISVSTLKRMEASHAAGMRNDVAAVRTVLERAGVTFLEAGGVASGPGVSLRNTSGAAIDVDENEIVQYPENLKNDAPPGAGG